LNVGTELPRELNVDLSVLLFSNTKVKLYRVMPINFDEQLGVFQVSIDLSTLNLDDTVMLLLDLTPSSHVDLTLDNNQL
jgi:hypothetical protein